MLQAIDHRLHQLRIVGSNPSMTSEELATNLLEHAASYFRGAHSVVAKERAEL
jgi:hypothetical protein